MCSKSFVRPQGLFMDIDEHGDVSTFTQSSLQIMTCQFLLHTSRSQHKCSHTVIVEVSELFVLSQDC